MSSKFKRIGPQHQAFLKLEGQKLLDLNDGGGLLSSLGGLPVAAKIAQDSGLIKMAADCIPEWRDPDVLHHPHLLLLQERVFLASCGLPNALDCSLWKDDPALKSALGQAPDGPSLPSQSTQTRMEQNISESTIEALEALPLKFFFRRNKYAPRYLTIYIDGSAIRTFGAQEKSTYRGGKKYSQNQYFPLIATTDAGDLLKAQLRPGGHSDACSVETVINLVRDIKAEWKHVQITVVMDTGFNSPELLSLLEAENVLYAIGYPTTSSIKSKIQDLMKNAEMEFRKLYGAPLYIGPDGNDMWQEEHERVRSLPTDQRMAAEKEMASRHVRWIYQNLHNGKNWDEDRPVIYRVDFTDKGLDIRCVVTNIKDGTAEAVYEGSYCRRSRVEMFIKEKKSHCKVPLSCQTFTANQFRFSGIQALAYMLLHLMRQELPGKHTKISLKTLRESLLLVPVLITVSERRIRWSLSSVHPGSKTIIRMSRKLQSRTA
jgi:hypothetical protein